METIKPKGFNQDSQKALKPITKIEHSINIFKPINIYVCFPRLKYKIWLTKELYWFYL